MDRECFMKILSNLAGSYLTSDEVAIAVMAYHGRLEVRGAAELCDVPVLDDGHARFAPIAVGALTQLTVQAVPPSESAMNAVSAELLLLAKGWSPASK